MSDTYGMSGTLSALSDGGYIVVHPGCYATGTVHYPVVSGYCHTLSAPTPNEETMNVPEPKDCACPKCEGRAVKNAHGNDWTMDVVDHDVTREEKKKVAKESGARARMRICATCGHVWATILSVREA